MTGPGATGGSDEPVSAKDFWENRYAEPDGGAPVWSGRVNHALAQVVTSLPAGRALDLGCGEGGDSIWLAGRGWRVTGVDISELALSRAAAAAVDRGLAERIAWRAADLATWSPGAADGAPFDLVSACFLQSPIELPRGEILRRVAAAIAPGGRLLVVSHATVPPWSRIAHLREQAGSDHGDPPGGHQHAPHLPTAAEDLAEIGLTDWIAEIAEERPREVTGPDGATATIDDAVVLLRRP